MHAVDICVRQTLPNAVSLPYHMSGGKSCMYATSAMYRDVKQVQYSSALVGRWHQQRVC